MSNEPAIGTRAICKACGERIVFVSPKWDHVGEMKPRHLAQPQAEAPPDLLAAVAAELARARSQHAPLHSAHEAYAVILEELDEVKAEVWSKVIDRAKLRKELIQLAAMAVRALEDLGL